MKGYRVYANQLKLRQISQVYRYDPILTSFIFKKRGKNAGMDKIPLIQIALRKNQSFIRFSGIKKSQKGTVMHCEMWCNHSTLSNHLALK